MTRRVSSAKATPSLEELVKRIRITNAAPTLLWACEAAVRELEISEHDWDCLQKLRRAIAKAEKKSGGPR